MNKCFLLNQKKFQQIYFVVFEKNALNSENNDVTEPKVRRHGDSTTSSTVNKLKVSFSLSETI